MQEEKQKELQQQLYTLEVYKAQMENLARQSELIDASLMEYSRAKETLERIKKLNGNEDFLIPIGANTFLFGKITDNKKAIVPLGSNVSVEEDIEKVIEKTEERIKELTSLNEKIADGMEKIQIEYSELTKKVQEMYREEKEEKKN